MRIGQTVNLIKKRMLKSAALRSKRLRDQGRVVKPVVKKELSSVVWQNAGISPGDVTEITEEGNTAYDLNNHIATVSEADATTRAPAEVHSAAKQNEGADPLTQEGDEESESRLKKRVRQSSSTSRNKRASKDAFKAMKRARQKRE